MRLGETILKKRQARGLSQEKLAELVGVSRQAVSKWEVGDAIPDTDKLIPLARALGITVDELLGNVPEEEEVQEGPVEPPMSGHYDASWNVNEFIETPKKRPGWFATRWYWLGMIPVIWGAWRLVQILIVLISALLFTSSVGMGGMIELVPEFSSGAEEVIIAEIPKYNDYFRID